MSHHQIRRGHRSYFAPTEAQVLEQRLLLSADFALATNVLRLDDFTQVADENLTIRENAQAYEFVLSEGVWSGIDGGGASGAGTAILAVDRSVAAGLKDGIRVIASGILADVVLETADFSSLAGGFRVTGAGIVSQAAGEVLEVSTAVFAARTIMVEGTVTGDVGDIDFIASHNIVFSTATVSTTSGAIRLQANVGAVANGGDFVGVLLAADPNRVGHTTVTTESGTIGLKGRGGDAGANRYGVRVHGTRITTATGAIRIDGEGGTGAYSNAGVLLGGTVDSTGANARAIVIRGIGGVQGGIGVVTNDFRLRSAEGDVLIEGHARSAPAGFIGPAGVGLSGTVESTGTGPDAATITVRGYAAAGGGTGLVLNHALLQSIAGDVFVTGAGIGSMYAGVVFNAGGVRSTGTGPDAADFYVTGTISGSDHERSYGVSMPNDLLVPGSGRIDTVDGSVFVVGTVLDGRGSGVYAKRNFISATGVGPDAGQVRITGTGSNNPADYGLHLNAARIATVDTDIVLVGVTGLVIDGETDINSTGTGSDAGMLKFVGGHRQDGYDVSIGEPTNPPTAGTTRIHSAGGEIAYIGDEIVGGPVVENPYGTTSFAPFTAGLPIHLGSAHSEGALALYSLFSDSTTYRIGDAKTGDIQIFQPYAFRDGRTLELITGGSVLDRTGNERPLLTVDTLTITAAEGIGTIEDPLEIAAGSFSAEAGDDIIVRNLGDLTLGDLAAERISIGVIGELAIASDAHLDTARLGSAADPLTPDGVIVFNRSETPITGHFVGLPEGATIRVTADGTRRITYRGGDGNDIALFTNSEPVATDDRFRVSEGGVLEDNVLTNDSDADADQLKLIAINGDSMSVGSPIVLFSGALLTANADGTFRYEPNGAFSRLLPGETAADSFQYTVVDRHGGRSQATVRIAITGQGLSDLVGFVDGGWYVAVSDGSKFNTTDWAGWADVDWEALLNGDVNGDGLTDVLGLYQGTWFVGISDGTSFTTAVWSRWISVEWQHAAVADLNGDGLEDILAEFHGQWWASLSTGSEFTSPSLWGTWSDLPWQQFFFKDLNADGRADLLGFYKGEWWAGLSAGDHFETPTAWARWADVDWDAIGTFDANGDQQQDVFGLVRGVWYVAESQGTHFTTSLRATWSDLRWQDAVAADFDGDGRDDLAARYAGEWWLSLSGASTVAERWAVWADVEWRDIRAGDYDGDGLADIAGRTKGEWWVAISTGDHFETSLWDTWQDLEWRAVEAVDASHAPASLSAAFAERTQTADDRDDMAKLWSATNDDELAAALLAI